MIPKRLLILSIVLMLGILPIASAEDLEPMETDRPDFTEGTSTIDCGHLQLETGYTFTYNESSNSHSSDHVVPELLLRIGVHQLAELRIGWEGWSSTASDSSAEDIEPSFNEDGATDISFGGKIHLLDQENWIPNFSVLADTSIPTGADSKSAHKLQPGVKLLLAYDMTDDLSLASNLNFAAPVDSDGRYFEPSSSLSLAKSITKSLGSYFEYFGFYPANTTASNTTHYLNGGFTYLVTSNLQLDIRAGFGLNNTADDFFTGTGLSIRL